MAYVITNACITEKASDCVMVCPVDCIEEGEDQYFIDPDTCIVVVLVLQHAQWKQFIMKKTC